VLVVGGADVVPDNLVQAFDPATGTTTVIGHMPGPRAGLVGAAVGNEVVLLAGFNGSALVGNVCTTSDGTSFSVAGQIATVERYPAIAVVGTTIYLFGGLVAGGEYNGTFSATVQSFDVATRQAHVVGQLPVPLAHARAAVLDGPVLVFGVAAYLVSGPAVSPGGALRPLVQVVALSLGATPSTGSMQAPLWRLLSLACGASRQCRLSTLVSEFYEHVSFCLWGVPENGHAVFMKLLRLRPSRRSNTFLSARLKLPLVFGWPVASEAVLT